MYVLTSYYIVHYYLDFYYLIKTVIKLCRLYYLKIKMYRIY